MGRLLREEAIEHEAVRLHRGGEPVHDRLHPRDRVAIGVDQGDPGAIDRGEGADAGPQRLDERVADLVRRAISVDLRAERREEVPGEDRAVPVGGPPASCPNPTRLAALYHRPVTSAATPGPASPPAAAAVWPA